MTTATSAYGDLHQLFGDDALALVDLLMALDTVFLDNGDAVVALLSPLHPLRLWHHHEYARVIDEQKDLLDEKDRALVRSELEAGGVPLFLASLGVPRSVSERTPLSLPFSGQFGGLPQFSERTTARDPHDGVRVIRRLIEAFKDDYSKGDYASAEGFAVHDATFGGLPFNPMVPPLDPESGRANPISHVHELANMLQRIYKLGDQQTYQLREAMKETYNIVGVGFSPFVPAADQEYLPFEAIRDVLVREDATTLLGRLSPIFDLGLFSRGDATTNLGDLLSSPTVIRLSQLPGDQVKNAVAEFFLMALHSFLIRREQPHRLERLLVLDEAWRLVDSPKLVPLMRESRAFGLGVIVATQFPKDLPDHVAGSTATRLYFNQSKAEQIREVQRTLVGKTSGSEADHLGNLIRGLAPMECVLQNSQYRPWIRLRTIPYFARVEEEAKRGDSV